MLGCDHTVKIHPQLLPSVNESVRQYEHHTGGHLTDPYQFGEDPLHTDSCKQTIRKQTFYEKYSFDTIFSRLVNGDTNDFRDGLKFFIDVTRRLFSAK